MHSTISTFNFTYRAGDIHYGRGCTHQLGSILEERGFDRALVVCGNTVGSTPAVMTPIREGVGDSLVGVFDGTKPSKDLAIAHDGLSVVTQRRPDVLIAVGGGSSIDIAKAIALLQATESSYEETVEAIRQHGELPKPENALLPVIAVPTTLAGADLSTGVSVTLGKPATGAPTTGYQSAGLTDPCLMPTALCYDPLLFETTPRDILATSAMNGFDKGIEMLYSRHATPITDATAIHGLRFLTHGLPHIRDEGDRSEAIAASVTGLILVQYGLSAPGAKKLNVIHAFGHAVSRHYDIQQGAVHAILAPHALRFVFNQTEARRSLLARAFDVDADSPDATAEEIIQAVTRIRDALGLPTQLRSVPGLNRDDLPTVAMHTLDDAGMANRPRGFNPSQEAVEAVLEAAW